MRRHVCFVLPLLLAVSCGSDGGGDAGAVAGGDRTTSTSASSTTTSRSGSSTTTTLTPAGDDTTTSTVRDRSASTSTTAPRVTTTAAPATSTTAPSTTAPPTTQPPTTTTRPPSSTLAMEISGSTFSPAHPSVPAGSVHVTVQNQDAKDHTFTVTGTSIDIAVGPRSSGTDDATLAAGTYEFHCRIHASMTGTLTVT